MEQPDPEEVACRNLGGRVRHLEIEGQQKKIYDYYYMEEIEDENPLVLTKRDEKLVFLKLFLDRVAEHDEIIKGWNYPYPFSQEFRVEKRITRWSPPEMSAKKLMKNIDSPWHVYFFYDYHRDNEPYNYYIGIETKEEEQGIEKREKTIEEQLRYALQKSKSLPAPAKVRLLSNVSGEFIVYHGGSGGVDYDSTRLLDHYVLVTGKRIYLGTLEFPRTEYLKPGKYRISGRTVPSRGIFGEMKVKVSIKSAECLEAIEHGPLDTHYRKNWPQITSYKSSARDWISKETDKASMAWYKISSNATSFIIFWIFSMIFIIGIISTIITVLS